MQQPLIETNAHTTNITESTLAKNRRMNNGLVDVLNRISHIIYHDNLANVTLNYARKFLLTLAEIVHRQG